jgi:hypothetical protein
VSSDLASCVPRDHSKLELLGRWLATLVEPEQVCISLFSLLTNCSSGFVEFQIGYSPPMANVGIS